MQSLPSKPKPKPKPSWQHSHSATGTTWHIDSYDEISDDERARLTQAIDQRSQEFEHTYSRFRDDSFVAQLAREAGTYPLPPDAAPMLDLYRELYEVSGGVLTPLIGQTLVDAGYDAKYSFQPKPTISLPPKWEDSIDYRAGSDSLTMKHPAQLDFGAIGKGYLVDLIATLIHEAGITGFCIDAGGDIYCRHPSEPLVFGLENPEREGEVIGTATLQRGSLCGSSGNRRRWDQYHHIINPHTGRSPQDIRAVWVTAESARLADGLATCLYFAPAAVLKKRYTFEYILVMHDGSAELSPDFPGQLFT